MRSIIINLFMIIPLFVFSQVGINTRDPQAILDVRALSTANGGDLLLLKDANDTVLLKINDEGKVHTKGVSSTPLSLDLRGNNDGDILAIGNTNLSHTEVGEGVLKYDPTQKSIFLSTDSAWTQVSFRPLRVLVSAIVEDKTQEFLTGEYTVLNNLQVISDSYNAFDPTTGEFTAPHKSSYAVYVSITFQKGIVDANSTMLIDIIASNGQEISCMNTYVVYSATNIPTIQCTGNFSLDKGDKIYSRIYHTTGVTRTILPDYSSFSIMEL